MYSVVEFHEIHKARSGTLNRFSLFLSLPLITYLPGSSAEWCERRIRNTMPPLHIGTNESSPWIRNQRRVARSPLYPLAIEASAILGAGFDVWLSRWPLVSNGTEFQAARPPSPVRPQFQKASQVFHWGLAFAAGAQERDPANSLRSRRQRIFPRT